VRAPQWISVAADKIVLPHQQYRHHRALLPAQLRQDHQDPHRAVPMLLRAGELTPRNGH
jgi:glutathionylspermidine synthase